MTLTPADVREELPEPSSSVADSRIQKWITSRAQIVGLELGAEGAASNVGEEIIRLYAASDARRRLDELSGRNESPAADALSEKADRLKEAYDKATLASDESGIVDETLVSNVTEDPLWCGFKVNTWPP